VICFDAFHAFIDELDLLIEQQEQAGDQPLRVRFASDLLHHLVSRGIGSERARRILVVAHRLQLCAEA